MPAQTKRPNDAAGLEGEKMAATISRHVLATLGTPGGQHRVDVRRLWDHHFRVNVLLGADAVSIRIAHSFFLAVDGNGNVVESTPAITRQY
jgi:hypothetical protein